MRCKKSDSKNQGQHLITHLATIVLSQPYAIPLRVPKAHPNHCDASRSVNHVLGAAHELGDGSFRKEDTVVREGVFEIAEKGSSDQKRTW